MPTLDGLSKAANLNSGLAQAAEQRTQQQSRRLAAQQAMDLFKQGDLKGAIGIMGSVDPDFAQSISPNLLATDPATQQGVAKSKTAGEYEVTTQHGSNPRQLLDAQIEAGKFKKDDSREARLGTQFNQNMGFKYQQSAEQSPIYKSAIGVINEMPTMKSLLDEAYTKGGQALSMLGPRIAKGLAGEVGVLTEQDVTRYVRNPALVEWLLSGASKKFEGKLTEQDYSNLMRLGTIMEENANKKMKEAYRQAAVKMSRNLGMDLEDAELLVNPNIDEPTKEVIAKPYAGKTEAPQGPKAGAVIKGYKFKGGDPADKNNWEKQ